MEHSGCEINRSERNSTNGDTRSSLGFGVFNPRTFNQDIKFYPNDNLLAVGAQSPVKAESRSRSWSVADTKTVFSTDSDNSDCSREVGNRFSASNQGEYHNFDCGKFQIDEGASRGPSPFAPPERTDNRWTQQSSPTTCVFSPRDDDKIHPTSLPNVDNLEPTLSSDSAPTGYDSLFPFPPTKSDKFADTFGFAAGIAQLSRNRGESLGESIRQEAPVSQPFFNRIAGPSQRSDIISDRSNEIRFESPLPTYRTTLPPYGSSLTDLEQPGYCSPTGFSPPRGAFKSSTAWMETRDQDRSAPTYHGPSREVGSLRLQDILPDHRPSGRTSFTTDSTMTSPRDYNNDSLFGQYGGGYNGSLSPHTECNSPNYVPRLSMKAVNPMDLPPPMGAKNICHQQSMTDEYSIRQRQHQSEIYPPINDGNVYQVQFKRCYRCFKLPVNSQLDVHLGEFIIVEADRGEDLGVVTAIAPFDSPHAASIYAASGLSMRMTNDDFSKKILRIATMEERVDLQFKRQQEVILLEVCRDRARDIHALPISLVDAEYQFDRNKLVIYYVASRRLDFREFVRDLFAVYKTRIWMEQAVPDANFTPSETVAIALQTGHLHMNPLITPAPAPRVRSGVESPVDYSHSGHYSPRLPERRNSTQSTAGYQARQSPQRDQGRMSYTNTSMYEQNLKQQEMRLAQHPQRQSNRLFVDQKCKELQLQKEKELNEELERGADSFHSLSLQSAILPY